jgi:hypothetical protein
MITLRDLLEDPQYKSYFLKVPKLPKHYTPDSEPWKLMILKKGEDQWRTKRFGTYKDAFAAVKKLLKNPDIYDMVINCPGLDWQPPIRVFQAKVKGKTNKDGSPLIVTRAEVWKPRITPEMSKHNWCPYCRRPTAFGYFEVHKAMTKARVGNMGANVDPSLLRCSICAASERVVNLRHPANHQNWDKNRVRVA